MLPQLDRYQVDRLLARGGMGEVFLGRIVGAHGFERPIVIKAIRGDLLADERVALMFVDEARIAAGLHHRNIVQVIDFGVVEGGAFLICEYVDGIDLRTVLAGTTAPPRFDVALTIIAELGTGLDAAHDATDSDGTSLGLVHRDVSPSNVLLGLHGEVKIADFGVAKARTRMFHTISGSIKGKPAYMAPEQIRGDAVDRRADVFALGVLLFEVTTRTRLYAGLGNVGAMNAILAGDVPDPATRRADYPPALARIIRRALQLDPIRRYQTARALVDDLDEVAVEQGWYLSPGAVGALVRDLHAEAKP